MVEERARTSFLGGKLIMRMRELKKNSGKGDNLATKI